MIVLARSLNKKFFIFLILFTEIIFLCFFNKEIKSRGKKELKVDLKKEEIKIKKELEKNFNSSFLHNQLALIYYAQNKFCSSIEEFLLAISLEPDNALNYFELAEFYLRKNQLDKSEIFINRAIVIDKMNPHFYYLRGNIYEEKGLYESAFEDYSYAFKLLTAIPKSQKDYQDKKNNIYSLTNLRKYLPKRINKLKSLKNNQK